jgi:hypothetical protein
MTLITPDRGGGRVPAALLAELHPIEKMWSKIKSPLQSTGVRTSATLDATISAAGAIEWFKSCGYLFS